MKPVIQKPVFVQIHFFCFLIGFTILLQAGFSALHGQTVRINEFMAANSATLTDEDGDYSDWIELFNPASEAVNLAGWSLTDDAADPRKWVFPTTSLTGDSYLVLFASGKDKNVGELHTNFRLDAAGEYLALIDAGGIVVSEFSPTFPVQQTDVSFGFFDGRYLATATPTPGAANQLDADNLLPPPHFSHTRGFYETPFAVQLTTELTDATIFYTLDGSEPAPASGILYSQPITVNTTTILRALVSLPGDVNSLPVTHTYLFLDDVIAQPNDPPGYPDEWGPFTAISGAAPADYEMDPEITTDPFYAPFMKEALLAIPTLSLVTKKENIFSHSTDPNEGGIYIYTGPPEGGNDEPGFGDGWERPASVEFFTADGSEEFQINCGVRLQGGHSRRPEKSPKHSFRLVFRDEYGPNRLEYPLFGNNATSSFNTIILRAGFGNEMVHWTHAERQRSNLGRDIWAKDTQAAMGHPAGHGRYVHLYINGLYWGIYNPTERLDRDFSQTYLGGDELTYDVIKDYTSVVDGTITAWEQMMDLANRGLASTAAFQRIQGNNPDGTPNPLYKPYVNVVSLIDYMLLNFYGGNTDWDHHNWVAIRNRTFPGKGFQFFSWDAEHVLKELNENVVGENNPNCPSNLFQRLAENADFRRLFADRVQLFCFNNGVLTPEATAARWSNRANQIQTAIIAETARWGDYRRDVHRYQESGPFELYAKENWLAEQDYLLNDYFPNRTTRLINQLHAAGLFPSVQAPGFLLNDRPITQHTIAPGDVLSMTAPAGSIYYTLDGSDPLASQTTGAAQETVLVPEQAEKRVLVPTATVNIEWRTTANFDDSAWRTTSGAPGGVGYETGAGYENLISLNVREAMNSGANPNTSCYLRMKFNLSRAQLDATKSLVLNVRYDDGFVAFLNGTQIAAVNAPAALLWNARATTDHEDAGPEAFNISSFISALVEGENLLAIHALNTNTTSSDFLINASLAASDAAGSSGGVSPSAILYTEPLELTHSTHVKARALLGDEWSALHEVMLVLPSDVYNLRLTEIHYHPAAQDTIENRAYEFIELKNVGPSPVDLSGVQFTRGLTYTFPMNAIVHPGGLVVLASNAQKFFDRYGFIPFGQYDGSLSNQGETIALVNVERDTLLSIRYNDKAPWPEAADGGGFSLVTKEPNPDRGQNDANLWRLSGAIHGSPGEDDPASTLVENNIHKLPDEFQLEQNYPNPFNPQTTISYAIPERAFVKLAVYDLLGREVKTLVEKIQEPNRYSLTFDGADLPSGIYFYRLRAGLSFVETKKMLLVR